MDVGHGGKDSGAIGINGIKEKDVALNIGLEIIMLNAKSETPLDIYLTRYSDTLISLSDRTKLAKALNADLFISLHCNHSHNPIARGIEVYVGKNESGNSKESVWFAYQLQNQIKKQLGFKSRGVKFSNFQVLREAGGFYPEALVELGFLSNDYEYVYLLDNRNTRELASILLMRIYSVKN
ncbi:N-acetylmuramoyl-L-alanine amidase [Salegentibacter sp. F188]|uniref:N-acetylmuramoyl-L-alanine amidase n=1 Tax=Autumnicola patrickiae TaxID=3075591 RepID=A0ABU3E775_9FLAO|nr:N-acetylmuramoyl-L-alanine amidase [Salegentibacter sp. F188]MDT0691834.1 N-acetylmuramoyl-L-alanine amidase [Salegentibacter sp. F188]